MENKSKYTEKLFSYGTLQYESVQLESFGRPLNGSSDALVGYELSEVEISDPAVVALSGDAVHPIVRRSINPQEQVPGMVFDISLDELHQADSYEVDEYKREETTLASGEKAWVYEAAE